MIVYRDRSFCIARDCKFFKTCEDALPERLRIAANVTVSQYAGCPRKEVEEVRPCPFCEGPAQLFSDINSEGKAEYCYGCQCGEYPCDWYETKEEALRQWNEWANIEA